MKALILAIILTLSVLPAHADEAVTEENCPRFMALGSDEVNVRTGPGTRYPIRFVLRKERLPVEVIKEFDVWRQIRTETGDEGWVNKTLLSKRRSVIVKGSMQTLMKDPGEKKKPIVKLEPGVIAALDRCEGAWCSLKVASYKGWLKRESIWGVYPDEKFGK